MILNIKFKGVPSEMKHQLLDGDFNRITGYADTARVKNIRMTEDLFYPIGPSLGRNLMAGNGKKLMRT